MAIDICIRHGLTGVDTRVGSLTENLQSIGMACGKFASTHILNMGRHYDQYVISGSFPAHVAVSNVLTVSAATANATSKGRAQSVSGNIGEGLAAIVARRFLGAAHATDIQPLLVSNKLKTPDFRMRFSPMWPTYFPSTGVAPPIFNYWPVEAKASDTEANAKKAAKNALKQLGSYWYHRRQAEPAVVGYGLIMGFVYKGTKTAPVRLHRTHVITPSNQSGLLSEIDTYLQKSEGHKHFLKAMFAKSNKSPKDPKYIDMLHNAN